MSKKGYISRYLLLIKKLQRKPYTGFAELQQYIETQLEYLQLQDERLNMGFSKRTLQRDIREINLLFGVQIEYSKRDKGYYIVESPAENHSFQRMLESFDLFHSLNLAQDLTPFILPENRPAQGTENLFGLLHAIKQRLQIGFSYQKFWEDEPTQRLVEPYALKEFKNRWYLLAKDKKDGKTKTFALDRLTELEISNQKYPAQGSEGPNKNFQYCFGIINPEDEKPQEIVLSIDPIQGKYIKTLPLHSSQKLLIDDERELRISLTLFITDDLIMELLSFGAKVKVLKPRRLVNLLQKEYEKAVGQYQ